MSVFVRKRQCNGVWGKAEEFSRIFLLKVTLHSVRLLLTVSNRKAGCTSCFPNNFVEGGTAPLGYPVPAPMYRAIDDKQVIMMVPISSRSRFKLETFVQGG